MKRIFLAFILCSSLCHAQDYYRPPVNHQPRPLNNFKDTLQAKSYFFSFNIGISVPLRDYGSKDTTRDFMIIGPDSTHGKGFANLGFHINGVGGVFLSPNFGVCVKVAYSQNSFDQTGLNAIINGNYTYQINSDFTIWQFMGGVFGNFQVDKVSSVWVQGTIGLINVNFPSFSIYNIPQLPPGLSWNFTLPNANDFAYSASIGYEKAISQNISFLTTISYTGSELVYPTLTYSYTGPYVGLPPPYTQNHPVTMSFGSLDFTLGLLFHL